MPIKETIEKVPFKVTLTIAIAVLIAAMSATAFTVNKYNSLSASVGNCDKGWQENKTEIDELKKWRESSNLQYVKIETELIGIKASLIRLEAKLEE